MRYPTLLASLCCLALLSLTLPTSAANAPRTHPELRRLAEGYYKVKDFEASRDMWAAALKLRPDSPRYLHNLAATQALIGQSEAALATLRKLAALGVSTAVERDADFASLRGKPAFDVICRAIAENGQPRGEARIIMELPDQVGVIEGLAFREHTGDWFFGDAHQRCIWRRDRDGKISRFTAAHDSLLGILGIAVDETLGSLWAVTAALPEMDGFNAEAKARTALVEVNLATGDLRRIIPLPDDGKAHALGDLLVTPDGTVYATDSAAPVIWQLTPGGETLQKAVEHSGFISPQGLVRIGQTLVVADYANGLFAVDLSHPGPAVRPLSPPANATLLGIDGLVGVPDGLVGIQNGITPARLIHISLSPDLKAVKEITVLASALPQMGDLSLITLVGGRPTFVAQTGWDLFDATKQKHPPAHSVYIFQATAP